MRFNQTFRTEVLDRYVFNTLPEVRRMTEDWRHRYNHRRPHRSLGNGPTGALHRGKIPLNLYFWMTRKNEDATDSMPRCQEQFQTTHQQGGPVSCQKSRGGVMSVFAEYWQLIVGLIAGYTINLIQVNVRKSNRVVQANNIVGGDISGRDIKK